MSKPKKKRKLTAKARKRMGYGRIKGGQFENEICRDVQKAFSSFGINPQDIYRSKQSGAHAISFGDISMSTKMMKLLPFAPECKWYEEINLYKLYAPWKKMKESVWIKKWWNQTIRGAEKKKGMSPLLIFKANNAPVLCAVLFSVVESNSVLKASPHFVIRDRDRHTKIWIGSWDLFLTTRVDLVKYRKHKDKHS